MSFKKTLLAAGLVATSTLATAMPITGSIGFAGDVTDTGTTLQFSNVSTFSATGDYAGLNGISTTIADIVYNPFYSVANPLWSFTNGPDTYSFEVATLTQQTVGPFFLLNGTGTLYATGYDPTPGTWSYSDQGITFSAQSANVSEPATLAMLGLGLAGLGFARRKQAKAA